MTEGNLGAVGGNTGATNHAGFVKSCKFVARRGDQSKKFWTQHTIGLGFVTVFPKVSKLNAAGAVRSTSQRPVPEMAPDAAFEKVPVTVAEVLNLPLLSSASTTSQESKTTVGVTSVFAAVFLNFNRIPLSPMEGKTSSPSDSKLT